MNNRQRKNEHSIRLGITGATGYVGKKLVELAISRGYKVVCLSRQSHLDNDLFNNVEIIQGNLSDYKIIQQFVSEIDVCIHLAAQVSATNKFEYRKVNIEGTRNICEAIRHTAPTCRLVYCSSVAVLRVNPWLPFLSTEYARSKRQATQLVKEYQYKYKLHASIIYPGLVFGPGDTTFFPNIIKNLKKGRLFFIHGGEKNAPLIYIDDLCEMLLRSAINPASDGKEFLGVSPGDIGIHDFIRCIAQKIEIEPPKLKLPKLPLLIMALFLEIIWRIIGRTDQPPLSRRVVDVLSINFKNISKWDNDALDWQPAILIVNGIEPAINWWKHNQLRD
ncbi:MAG: NAD(P)-dependent oxidoreductase [Deltaproteobacteria bacterium]|nr:NAD(P)-dependent oxidoreductase [Deltaproteobacteria bacterium]